MTLFHSWTRDGPGREHGPAPDRVRGAGARPGAACGSRSTPSASSRPARPRPRAATVLGGRAVLDAAARLHAALQRRRDRRARRAGVPRASSSSTGRRPTRRPSPSRTSRTPGRRRSSILDDEGRLEKVIAAHDVGRAINPTLVEGQIEGGVHMGLGQALSEEFVVEGGVPQTTDAEVAAHRPADRDAAGRGDPRRGAAARGPVRREGRRRGRARPDRGSGRRRALRLRRRPPHAPADEGLAGCARRGAAPRAGARPGGRDDRPLARPGGCRRRRRVGRGRSRRGRRRGRRASTARGCRDRAGQRLRAHAPLLGARARDAVRARRRRRPSSRSCSGSGGGSTARSTRRRSAPPRSSARWRRCCRGRRRSSTTTPRRTRSTGRST